MRDFLVLLLHLIVTIVRLIKPGGYRSVVAESRIHNVSRKLSIARDEMMRAHKRLNAFIEHGIVPEDLKPSG